MRGAWRHIDMITAEQRRGTAADRELWSVHQKMIDFPDFTKK
eukprot:COSAG02_NODE_11376_length_1737_cov_1.869963_1_plen_42_part_00